MANYKYIIVNKPDRGLMLNEQDANISNEHCSDCKNVYFRDGQIIKRFGYGTKKSIVNDIGIVSAGNYIQSAYTDEATHIQMHESNINVSTATRRLYGFSLEDAMYYKPVSGVWKILGKDIDKDATASGWLNWDEIGIQYNGMVRSSFGGIDIGLSPICSARTANIRVEIDDDAANPNTFRWRHANGGPWIQAGVACTTTPVLLSAAGTQYSYASFSLSTGGAVSDYSLFQFGPAETLFYADTTSGPNGSCITGASCLLVSTLSKGFTAFKYYNSSGWGGADTLSFWFYANRVVSADDFRFKIANDSGAAYGMPLYSEDSAAHGAFINVPIDSTYPANTWNNAVLTFSTLPSTYSQTSRLLLLEVDFDGAGWKSVYFDYLQLLKSGGTTNLSATSTKKSPTLSDAVLANINSSTQSYLVTTNYEQEHYVRYIDNGITDPKWMLVAGAADAGSGYNDTSASDYHKCKAISGYKEKLHLLGGSEDTAGTGAVDKLLQDRWSATNDAMEWQGGVATARNVADTSGAILNAVRLTDDNNYIFKTDAIVRQSFLGGESAIFSYNTVFQEDALLAAKMVQVIGDYCYWVGRRNVYAFGSGTTMSPIGDGIESEFYSTDGIEYAEGQYHRRSFWMDMSIVNLVGIMVPVSSNYPDKAFMFDPDEKVWAIWDFSAGTSTNITASDYAIGLVTEGTETNLQHSVHFGNSSGEFYEFDTTAKNDGAKAIDGYWISKAFSNPKSERAEITAWNGLDFEAKGDGITVSIKADDGAWQEIETKVLTSSYDWYTVGFHQQARFLKIKFSNSTLSETFSVRSFTMRYEDGATH